MNYKNLIFFLCIWSINYSYSSYQESNATQTVSATQTIPTIIYTNQAVTPNQTIPTPELLEARAIWREYQQRQQMARSNNQNNSWYTIQ